MISPDAIRALAALCDGPVQSNVSTAGLVTLKAGGPAAVLVEPRSLESVRALWTFCHREGLPTLVRGRGSNLLVRDSGFAGVVFQLGGEFVRMRSNGSTIFAGAGAAQPAVAHLAAELDLAGAEFLVGIPGTMGGGVYMNAGCYGREFADIIEEVDTLTADGEIRTHSRDACAFQVRRSCFQRSSELILSMRLTLSAGSCDRIREQMHGHVADRRAKQPRQHPNCGSVFKNPPGAAAWKLIDDAGFRGQWSGGAQVSEKHPNFILNRNSATAGDINALIAGIQAAVFSQAAVVLEPELIRV